MDQLVFILPMILLHVESVVDVTKSSVSSKLIFELNLELREVLFWHLIVVLAIWVNHKGFYLFFIFVNARNSEIHLNITSDIISFHCQIQMVKLNYVFGRM